MYNDMRRDSEPVEQGPVQAVTSQMRRLIEIGGEPFDRDIDLVNKDRQKYGVAKVGIDVDPDTGVFRCVLTRHASDGEFAHQDWYKVTPTDQMYYEEVVVPFAYDERVKMATYDKALADWSKQVAQLQKDGKLSDVDEYTTLDNILSEYISMRAAYYRRSQAMHSEVDSDMNRVRQDESKALRDRQRDILSRHLHGVHTALGEEDFASYKLKFEEVLISFTSRLAVMDAAEFRLVEASKEANDHFDLGISNHASSSQAWQLLAVLDACQDYTT